MGVSARSPGACRGDRQRLGGRPRNPSGQHCRSDRQRRRERGREGARAGRPASDRSLRHGRMLAPRCSDRARLASSGVGRETPSLAHRLTVERVQQASREEKHRLVNRARDGQRADDDESSERPRDSVIDDQEPRGANGVGGQGEDSSHGLGSDLLRRTDRVRVGAEHGRVERSRVLERWSKRPEAITRRSVTSSLERRVGLPGEHGGGPVSRGRARRGCPRSPGRSPTARLGG